MSFNVLSRRAGAEDAAYLATRMQFNEKDQRVILERFKVFSFPEALVVERADLNLAKRFTTVDLFRKRPTFCEVHLEGGKDWEFVFETKELCRTFAKSVKGVICLDGEYHAEDENAAGFQVMVNGASKAVMLVVGASVFMRVKSTEKSTASAWRELSALHWTRQLLPTALSSTDEHGEPLTVEFRERSARERFLARLTNDPVSKPIRVFTGTWNVGNAPAPSSRELARSWLDLALPADQRCFDLYVFGLQECSKRDDWVRSLSAAVEFHVGVEVERVERVAVVTMREVVLAVFAHGNLPVRVLGQDTRPTGIANTIGNKGAVGVGLDLYEFGTLAIVSAHLSAFQDNVKRRAQDQRMILKHLNLMNSTSEEAIIRVHKQSIIEGVNDDFDNIECFDRVVFLGDLNYRIDMGSSGTLEEFQRVELMARGGRWGELAPYDQLSQEMSKERVFFGYAEVKPLGSFPPTYRMNKDQQGYSNKRDQNPSFTDRILIKGNVIGATYGANHELVVRPDRTLTISDHRPVYAGLEIRDHDKAWSEPLTFDGANERDFVLRFDEVSFRSIYGNSSERPIAGVDENSRFPELDAPAEAIKIGTPILKRRLSGMASTRYLLRRNNSSGTTNGGEEGDDLPAPGTFDEEVVALLADENVELKVFAPWSVDYPNASEINGASGQVRAFTTLHRIRVGRLKIGVYSRPRALVGYARFTLPESIEVDQEFPNGGSGGESRRSCG